MSWGWRCLPLRLERGIQWGVVLGRVLETEPGLGLRHMAPSLPVGRGGKSEVSSAAYPEPRMETESSVTTLTNCE